MATPSTAAFQTQQSSCSEASESDVGYSWSEGDPLGQLPYDVLLHLLDYVPPRHLMSACRLVCKAWKNFFDEPSFWQLRMKRHGRYDPKLEKIPAAELNWAQLCLHTVHEPNLVRSFLPGSGELSLVPWTLDYGRDEFDEDYVRDCLRKGNTKSIVVRRQRNDGWLIEEWIKRDDEKDRKVLKENRWCTKNYVTTYFWCLRWQLVDLYKYGFSAEIMDMIQPPIHVSEWFCARWDCGSTFKIRVSLLDKNYDPVKTYTHTEVTKQWEGGELGWRKVEHVFRNYGVAVRYVLFMDGGKDTQFWAGHFGSKMAAANVQVQF